MDRDQIRELVIVLLSEYRGPGACIRMKDLLSQMGENVLPARVYDQTRIIRSVVRQLREEGHSIAFRQGRDGGYFMARDADELQPTINTFHSRALASMAQEKALRKISLRDLFYQYELDIQQGEMPDEQD